MFHKLKNGEGEYAGADPEDKDEYKAENVFFVPEKARWSYLQSKSRLPEIGKEVDQAMDAIEKENPTLKDVLPKVFARGNLDPTNLGGLIDLGTTLLWGMPRPEARMCLAMFLNIRGSRLAPPMTCQQLEIKGYFWTLTKYTANDSHKDLKADYVIANPPFNDSDWSGDIRKELMKQG